MEVSTLFQFHQKPCLFWGNKDSHGGRQFLLFLLLFPAVRAVTDLLEELYPEEPPEGEDKEQENNKDEETGKDLQGAGKKK